MLLIPGVCYLQFTSLEFVFYFFVFFSFRLVWSFLSTGLFVFALRMVILPFSKFLVYLLFSYLHIIFKALTIQLIFLLIFFINFERIRDYIYQ